MSKKIAKFTWLHNGNYGTALQAVALHLFLKKQGYEITDIDYCASTKTKLINWFVNKNSPDLFVGKFKEFFGKKDARHADDFRRRYQRIDDFIKNNIKLSKRYDNPNSLKSIIDDYDIFMCGSDQVWSPYLLNPVYYLDFLPDEKKRISYATSFGVTTTTNQKKRKIKSFLQKYSSISVREEQGKQFVKELTNKDVPVVLDPTLLLDRDTWERIATSQHNGDYVFCFLLTPNDEYVNKVKQYGIVNNKKVIIVPTPLGPFDTGFEEHIDIDPQEWISLIRNADFVFTDSFHGFIFSVIFEKNFVVLKRFSDSDKKSQNSRIYSLAKMLNIENRIIDATTFENISSLPPINYKDINILLSVKRAESIAWLLAALDEVN